jgi:DNA-binding beta-propeller fold protein YncE
MQKKLASIFLFFLITAPQIINASYLEEFAYIGSQDHSIRVTDLENGNNFKINNVYAPVKIYVTPNSKYAYSLTSTTYGGLHPIDITTHQLRSSTRLYSRHVTTVEFSPDSQRAYVGAHNSYQFGAGGQCQYGGGLRTLNTETNQEIGCQNFGDLGPRYISVRPDGEYIYAHYHIDRYERIIVSRQVPSGTVSVGSITLPVNVTLSYQNVRWMTQSPDGAFLYVLANTYVQNDGCSSCDAFNYGYIHKIDMNTNLYVNFIRLHPASLTEIKITTNGYACAIDSRYKKIHIINLSDNSIQSLSFESANQNSIKNLLVSSDGKTAYILDSLGNKVFFVDIVNASILGEVSVGSGPYEMALSSDENFLYVTNYSSNSVSVIETTSMTTFNTFSIYAPKPIALIPPANNPPQVDAGPSIMINSFEQNSTIICGSASDSDNDSLTYRWIFDTNELSTWQPIGLNGQACLNLGSISQFQSGAYNLLLEVSDNSVTTSDSMTLTVENSDPAVSPSGAGAYEINSPIVLSGEISDFDGDLIFYSWSEGANVIFSGQINSIPGGAPVTIPDIMLSQLSLGDHVFTLSVSDGVNPPVLKTIIVSIADSTFPTLAPVVNTKILWPPNQKMVDIQINANASDNSGFVALEANILSSEAEEGLGDGDMSPDWTAPVIDQATGQINFQLRAERSGLNHGRVYTIKISATDDSGNVSFSDIEIVVPHDMRIK